MKIAVSLVFLICGWYYEVAGLVCSFSVNKLTSEIVNKLSECCRTPDEKDGECIVIDSCDYLTDMMLPNMTNEQRIVFSKHRCGIEDGEIKVCCPTAENGANMDNRMDIDLLPTVRECDNSLVDRIVGGKETKITEFPSMVLIKYVLRKIFLVFIIIFFKLNKL